MRAPVQEPVRTRARETSLRHVYLPWSITEIGPPPVGVRALCGHVRDTLYAQPVGPDDPSACVVCTSLLAELRSR